jgi:PAS domain S-box-containing protein
LVDYFNPQWVDYTGMPAEDIDRLTFMHFIHPDDHASNLAAWRSSMESGEPFTFEHRFRDSGGKYRWHLTRAHALRDSSGKIQMWIGSSTDIHDIRQARKRQERLEHKAALLTERHRHLMELNRAKDEFISLASHQLRTPATGVKQFLGMILDGFAEVEVPPQIRRMIEVAYESNERQLKIVNDLLQVAYVDAGKVKINKERFDMLSLIADVLSEMDGAIKERQQSIRLNNSCRDATVMADNRLLRMVLENLIDNASKYSLQGKTITIGLRCTKKFFVVDITDQGVGISTADQEKLFKKFSRIDNPLSTLVGGTGLGLYWVQQIMSLHGGTVSVKSTLGKGSTFTVKMPLA